MAYKPKIVTGKVTGTGWPIDGHVLYFSQWDYDREKWNLYGWEDADDEAVMLTIYQTETEAGLCCCDTLEAFTEHWKAKKWEPQGTFCLTLEQVEVLEIKQEEQPDETREKLRANGIDLRPREKGEKGGILCLPLDENLNGDVQAKHPDWQKIDCPNCGRKCWLPAGVDKIIKEQELTYLCTRCALEAGLVKPYIQPEHKQPELKPVGNIPQPVGNRAQRRRANRGKHGKQRK